MAKQKLKLNLTSYKGDGGIEYELEHCGKAMVGKPIKQPHWNCDPIKWVCEKCGRVVKTDVAHYECPRPKHMTFELEVKE